MNMKLHPKTHKAYQLLHNGVLAFARAEQQGIRVDVDYVERKKKSITRRIQKLEEEFKATKFFRHWQHSFRKSINIYSPQQLATFLYKIKRIKIEKETISGQGSTDEETLTQLGIPELDILIRIKKLKKIRDTYLEPFLREQVDGYIHPFFNLHLVQTYRSSSDSPNFQNIPKRDKEAMKIVRKALYPRPGHQLLEIDYSGIEVRIAACYHKDSTMLQYINDPTTDMHRDMAQQIFILKDFDKTKPGHNILRQAAKNGFVFPQFYGDYYKNCAINLAKTWGELPLTRWESKQGIEIDDGVHLSDHLISKGITGYGVFENHIKKIEKDFWGKRFSDYYDWRERWWKGYQKNGYINTFTHFSCGGVMTKNSVINYPIQGTAFHCLLWAFIEMDRTIQDIGLKTRLIGQVHDSILFDVLPEELEYIITLVERITCDDLPKVWTWLNVPLKIDIEICDIDASWAEKRDYNS